MKIFALIIFCLLGLSMAEYAGKYPTGDFASPVQRDIKLSGTFGELRANHFHAGLDIKSLNGVTGDPVYAASSGFISRIRIEEYGYGNVLYIQHPNGFTTVYAHLDRFSPEIDSFIKKEQYKAESFEIDLCPAREIFPVTQGQQIAFMGNTGYSFGAHLHFEIRHTENQVPINPLHFGLNVEDHLSPVLQQLLAYEFNETGDLQHTTLLNLLELSPGQYTLESPFETGYPMVAFGMRTYDMQDGTTNQNGIYSIQCKADEDPSFAFTLDEIPFEQTRYINAHIDYREKVNENKLFHRCFPLEGNKLPIYYTGVDKGMMYLNAELPRHISLTVSDFNGNRSDMNFEVIRNHSLLSRSNIIPPYLTMAEPEQVSIISLHDIQVIWPKGSFYEKTPLNIEIKPRDRPKAMSPFYEISPVDIPVHSYFDILIDGQSVPESLHTKAFIARCEPEGGVINCGGKWVGNNLTTGIREMNTYAIMVDTIPPSITVLHFGPIMTGWKRMAFRISDNFRIKDRGRDLLYKAWVDGKWILMALDGKSGILIHEFDGSLSEGDHQLRLQVTDDRGNETVLEKSFTL